MSIKTLRIPTRDKLRITAEEEGWDLSLDDELTDRFIRGQESVVIYYLRAGGIGSAFHHIHARHGARCVAICANDRAKKATVRKWLTGE